MILAKYTRRIYEVLHELHNSWSSMLDNELMFTVVTCRVTVKCVLMHWIVNHHFNSHCHPWNRGFRYLVSRKHNRCCVRFRLHLGVGGRIYLHVGSKISCWNIVSYTFAEYCLGKLCVFRKCMYISCVQGDDSFIIENELWSGNCCKNLNPIKMVLF